METCRPPRAFYQPSSITVAFAAQAGYLMSAPCALSADFRASPAMTRSLLIDDDALARDYLRALLASHPEVEIVGKPAPSRLPARSSLATITTSSFSILAWSAATVSTW
jgi:hypothetical protein